MHGALEKEARWKTVLSWLVVVVLTPITVWAGTAFGSGSYYVTSILVIHYAMVPFFVSFESRRPQARELVIIAVMCCACRGRSRGVHLGPALQAHRRHRHDRGCCLGVALGLPRGGDLAARQRFRLRPGAVDPLGRCSPTASPGSSRDFSPSGG